MNRLIVAAVAAVIVLYVLFSSMYVVNSREQAIVMRFGRITDVHTQPGLYFKLPTSLVDSVQIVENRLLRYDIANMRLQVSGGQFYIVDAFLTYRVTDARLFRERAQGDLRIAEQRIGTRFDAALRQVYGLRGFEAALSQQRTQMMVEARDLIKPDLAELGIDVVDVRILRTDLTPEAAPKTYDRMKAERLAEAAELRAKGQEAAQSLRAIADRQAVEIVASAQRDAEVLRGEGDAQRSAVFAQAYGKDPDFFEFYRSMQSYKTSLGSNSTTMVLSPDSEFFQFFGNDGAQNATLPAIPSANAAPVTPAPPSTPPAAPATPPAAPVNP